MSTPLDGLAPGDRLGDLEVVGVLGHGAMGIVYEARRAGDRVAIKEPSRQVTLDGDLRARFEREAHAQVALAHPGVVRAHALRHAGWPDLELELVPGGSLRDRLRARGQLPWREAGELALGVARDTVRRATRDSGGNLVALSPGGGRVAWRGKDDALLIDAVDAGVGRRPASVDLALDLPIEVVFLSEGELVVGTSDGALLVVRLP